MPMETADLEAIVCATLIDRPSLLDDITLSYTDFADEQYALVYRTIAYLVQNGKAVSNVTIIEKLKDRVDEVHLTNSVNALYAQPWALEQHVQMIREKAVKKRMTRFAQRLMELAQSGMDLDEILADAEQSWDSIRDSSESDSHELKRVADILPSYEERIDERVKAFRNGEELTGIHTGFKGLDLMTFGFQPTYLYIVGARPSMGKTAFSLQSAMGASKKDCAAIFSIEMDETTLLDRIMSSTSQIEMHRLQSGTLASEQMKAYSNALEELRNANVWIDDSSIVTIQRLRSRVRRLKRKLPQGKRLVVYVDYLQIMEASKGRSRTEEVGNLSRSLKQVAKECDCAVVALVQLSRNVEQRADKHPVLADIRESGSIEQDADLVAFLYRDDYYNKETDKKNILEVIIAKQRNGKTGTVEVYFRKEYQQLIDLALDKEATP